jgi:hypothetical protein
MVCEWFGLKTTLTVSSGLAQNLLRQFLAVWPQNQGDGGFPGLRLKTDSFGLVIWASKLP